MITCKRFRIEVYRCQSGTFHVTVQPLEYLGREHFKRWIKLCKRSFMALASHRPWTFENVFGNYTDAVLFARTKGQFEIVAPKATFTEAG